VTKILVLIQGVKKVLKEEKRKERGKRNEKKEQMKEENERGKSIRKRTEERLPYYTKLVLIQGAMNVLKVEQRKERGKK
jgi:hypothetical protein